MTDFEDKLRESLRHRADAADVVGGATGESSGLAAGARRRLRRRRTATATAGVLAAAVIATPFLVGGQDEPRSQQIAKDPSPAPTAIESPAGLRTDMPRTDGLRTESWRDVTFEVPQDWGYGAPTGQCVSSASIPSVGRPGDLQPSVDCAGPGFGAVVETSAPETYAAGVGDVWHYDPQAGVELMYPQDSWVGIWYDDEVAVTVATPDEALTRQIVGSVRVVDGVDDNGCAPLLGFAEASKADGSDAVSVCRYDNEDALQWSRRVTGADADALLGLVTAAPERTADYDCPTEDGLGRFALLDGGAYVGAVVTGASCPGNGGVFLLDDSDREVTPELSAALERPMP